MRFGYMSMNSSYGIRPDVLARELEGRGFDSMWVPEHSHIPVSRQSPYPAGGDLPAGYLHMMDPLVSLAVAAGVTTDITLATGICLLLEHDLLDLAEATATLDVVSGGRLLLGVGVGWNREELANHRPDVPFAKRYSAMEERVEALRTIWRDDEPEFEGTWERFTKSWVYPKPTGGSVPIALGNSGPTGIAHAARYADHWCPIDTMLIGSEGKPDVGAAVQRFRDLVADGGRDPDAVPISLMTFSRPKPDRLERYGTYGLERLIVVSPSADLQDESFTLRHLDELAPIVEEWRQR